MSEARPPPPASRPGLDPAEAARRLAEHGPNLLPGSTPKSLAAIVGGVLTEPMFLMLLVAGGLYLALGDRAEAAFLLSFVFVVIGITLAQERKTQRALESLRELSAPRALVIRGGQEIRIPGREVVIGDLLVLHEGDRIAADAVLLDGHLDVNESLLTGEAVPVTKLPGNDAGQLFASTVVTKGVGVAEVHAVAESTAVGRIGQALTSTVEPISGLQQASRRLIRNLTIGGLLLATAYALLGWLWDGHGLLESVLAGIALTMAILPEEIPVILTVFLALGAWRISRHKVLTRRVPAVEALGAISVLAVDKTGTLTQNRMQVAELRLVDDSCHDENSTELPEPFHELVEFAMLATPLDPFDPMEKAIQQFGLHWLTDTEHVHAEWAPEFEYALSPEILAMTHVFRGDAPPDYLTHPACAVPVVAGWYRPRIILPADFSNLFDPNEQRLILAHERTHRIEQLREFLRLGRDRRIRGVHRRRLHRVGHLPAHRGLLRQHLGEEAVLRVRRRHDDQPAHQLRMLEGELQRRAAAERIAHDVHLAQTELLHDDGEVATDVDEVDLLARAERGMAVPVQVDADHSAARGELRERGTEHAGREQPAVEQQQRLALAVHLEPVVHAVGGDVAARVRSGRLLCAGDRGGPEGDDGRSDECD